jgi:hypothetical protein
MVELIKMTFFDILNIIYTNMTIIDRLIIEYNIKKYGIKNYTINSDGSIDVNGNVALGNLGLKKIPLKFRNVSGYFNCCENQLTSLEGAPISVGDNFICTFNQLTSLEGAPISVGDNFISDYSNLDYRNYIKQKKREEKLKSIGL